MKRCDPVKRLFAIVREHGSQAAASRALGIGESYLSDLLRGRRAFSDAMLARMGLERQEQIIEKAAS